MGPYAEVDYNLTLCQLQSRANTFTMGLGNPLCQNRLYPPVRDFGFGLGYPANVLVPVLYESKKSLKDSFFCLSLYK
jgi:hypothetical protein